RAVVRRRSEREPVLREADAPGVVVRVAEELELRAVGLESEEPRRETVRLAPRLAGEARVADHRPHPIVEAPAQVARPRVRVDRAPAMVAHDSLVFAIVAVRVAKEARPRRGVDDDAVAIGEEARRDAQVLGESRELVRAAVVVGVLDDADAVAALGLRSELVWIVDRLGDPKPATRVPIHADRLADLGLRDEERHLESVRDDEVL